MKIALIHDWLVTKSGAEKVLKEIYKLCPDSDIFTIVNFLSQKDKKNIFIDEKNDSKKYSKNPKIITSFVQKLPFAKKYFRYYFPLFPKAIESFDLSSYDLIISSSWGFAKGVKKHKNQIHICYCHTPIRYAWDLHDEYTKDLFFIKKILAKPSLKYIRAWDIASLDRVDFFIANSKFVANRIKKIYSKNAKVIYPPLDIDKFNICKEKSDFYLSVSRLVAYKKTRLIIEAFNEMPNKTLLVIGQGEQYEILKKIAKENIHILGFVDEKALSYYMQKAKAFVYAGIEDFGIVFSEALASGTPIVAFDGGGAKKIVDGKKNGLLFRKQDKESIKQAIKKFENMIFNPSMLRQNALKYTHFQNDFSKFLNSKMKK